MATKNDVLFAALELEVLDTIRRVLGPRAPWLKIRERPAWDDDWSSRALVFTDPGQEDATRGLVLAASALGLRVAELALERLPDGVWCVMGVAFARGGDRRAKTLELHVAWTIEPA